jgi:uncharacterized small protein (DUF1192 family)
VGALDFWWNASQSSQIAELVERIEDLEKKVVVLKEWVDYLEAERKKQDDQS